MSTTCFTRRGFTLVELVLSSSLLLLLVGSLALALRRADESSRAGSNQVELQSQAARALRAVVGRLERSGFGADGTGRAFPHLFTGGTPLDPSFVQHAYPEPAAFSGEAAALPPEFQAPSRALVFRTPADLDDDGDPTNGLVPDGRPDLDALGELVWDAGERALVVVDGPDGVRRLEERIDGGAARTLARNVDRIECSTSAQDPVGVPPGAVRVRLWLHRRDGTGALQRLAVERLVRLENG